MTGDTPDSLVATPGSQRIDLQLGDVRAALRTSGSEQIASREESNAVLLVHGDIYEPSGRTAQLLLDRYLETGDSPWPRLHGSFAVLILDGRRREVRVITDRLNSRKVFVSEDAGGWSLSTSLETHPATTREIDPAAIGSILTSGVCHLDLTPFRSIRTLARASVHSFSSEGQSSFKYWSYSFTGENANQPRRELREGMAGLLRDAVMRRVETVTGDIFLSLSGGYDSKSIAGYLAAAVADRERIRSFTYHHGPEIGDTDASSARDAAERLGISHEIVPAYRGHLLAVIETNAARGQGLANFCDEVDAWTALGPRFAIDSNNALFVGDIFWNRASHRKSRAPRDILGQVDIYPPEVVDRFLNRLDPGAAAKVREGWSESFSKLEQRVPEGADPRDAQEVMYLDQRIANTLMLWRECFQMPYVRVMNPYLDNEVLDFIRTLPPDLRDHKILYKEAVSSAFPDLFELPIARGGFNVPDWGRELLRSKSDIGDWVRSFSSPLDDLIPPEVILSLLDRDDRLTAAGSDSLAASGRFMARRSAPLRATVRMVKSRVLGPAPRRVPWHVLLRRLLSLRRFLSSGNS